MANDGSWWSLRPLKSPLKLLEENQERLTLEGVALSYGLEKGVCAVYWKQWKPVVEEIQVKGV